MRSEESSFPDHNRRKDPSHTLRMTAYFYLLSLISYLLSLIFYLLSLIFYLHAFGPAATTSGLMWVYFLKFSVKLLASFLQLAS